MLWMDTERKLILQHLNKAWRRKLNSFVAALGLLISVDYGGQIHRQRQQRVPFSASGLRKLAIATLSKEGQLQVMRTTVGGLKLQLRGHGALDISAARHTCMSQRLANILSAARTCYTSSAPAPNLLWPPCSSWRPRLPPTASAHPNHVGTPTSPRARPTSAACELRRVIPQRRHHTGGDIRSRRRANGTTASLRDRRPLQEFIRAQRSDPGTARPVNITVAAISCLHLAHLFSSSPAGAKATLRDANALPGSNSTVFPRRFVRRRFVPVGWWDSGSRNTPTAHSVEQCVGHSCNTGSGSDSKSRETVDEVLDNIHSLWNGMSKNQDYLADLDLIDGRCWDREDVNHVREVGPREVLLVRRFGVKDCPRLDEYIAKYTLWCLQLSAFI
ncbi:hypothetical protein B0H14DRAFT_2619473 [Mycena olivaceomarginata]|nr:hypothetical protein B0H14DRAFT_2619473 [Mycena olivaceomarginata]